MNKLALVPIPEESMAVVKPKPTRSEIIDAMTTLKVAQIRKEGEEAKQKLGVLHKKIDKACVAFVKRNLRALEPSVRTYGHARNNSASGTVSFDITPMPPELVALILEGDTLKDAVYRASRVNEREVRKEIAQGMNAIAPRGERVNALLANASSRKALEAALEQIAA